MKQVFEKIKDQIRKCQKANRMFFMPADIDFETKKNVNSISLEETYIVSEADENITVDFSSRDTSKPFQNNPDRTKVTVRWKKNSELVDDYSDSWLEG